MQRRNGRPTRQPPAKRPAQPERPASSTPGAPLSPKAERLFRQALDECEEMRFPVEIGRCHQGLAELTERRGDFEAAREHLDAAGELFAKYGAKLYLDQVIAKKEILKA